MEKLCAVGVKPVAQQLLQFPVEAFDPLADLLLIRDAVSGSIDREATPASLDARAERDKTLQPALDRIARGRSFVEDALGVRDDAGVIAVQYFQEQRILVAERRIEATLCQRRGGRGVGQWRP